jgi:hypothetical protein
MAEQRTFLKGYWAQLGRIKLLADARDRVVFTSGLPSGSKA